MSTTLHDALEFTLAQEGGTNFHVYDRGGLTKYGICQKQYPAIDIENLTLSQARSIYQRDYWLPTKCDQFVAPLAMVMFDSAVNCGAHSARIWLQKALGNVKVDGVIGPITLEAVKGRNGYDLAAKVAAYRLRRYSKLIKRDPTQRAFVRGWMNRCAALMLAI